MKYINLLKTNPLLRNLLFIAFLCMFGAWFSHMAVYTLLLQLGAPNWAISTTSAASFLSIMLLGIFTGSIIDLIDTKTLLLGATVVELLTVVAMLYVDSLEFLYLIMALVFIRMGASGLYFGAEMALLAKTLKKENLKLANGLHSMLWSITYALGMAGAGIFIHHFGTKNAFILDIYMYCAALVVLFFTPIPKVKSELKEGFLQTIKSGLIYLKTNKKILHLIILHACVGFTTYDALIAFLADNEYKHILSIALTMGIINTSRAVSLAIGQITMIKYINKKTLFLFLLLQGVGLILWAALQFNFYISLVGIAFTGFFSSLLWSYTYTLLQLNTDPKYYGRVIAYNDMFFMFISSITALGIGILYEFGVALNTITALLGLIFFAFAFYWIWVLKNHRIKG